MKNINILKDLKTLNKLHTSSVESYTTNNGIVDFTCDNAGYVDNVVIEGKTLVNLTLKQSPIWEDSGTNASDGNRIIISDMNHNLVSPNIPYTFFNCSDKDILILGLINHGVWSDVHTIPSNSSMCIQFNEGNHLGAIIGYERDGWTSNDLGTFSKACVVLEGNHTDKPISYFEGLKSVGQGDNIEVLTYNKANNLIEDTFTYTKDMVINYTNGEFRSAKGHYACDNYIKIEPSTDYMFVGINGNRAYYDENKQVVPPINNSYLQILLDKTNGSKKNFAVEKSPSNARYIKITIHKDNLVNGRAYLYKSSNYDKKQISTTLRSLPNGVKDTIEKRGNKYVKVQRCGEVTLNGNEQVGMYISNGNTAVFGVIHKGQTHKRGLGICDKLRYHMVFNTGEEHFYLETDNTVNIEISLSKLSSANEEGLKTWLKSNPTTVVYELETPIITELPNFNPQTYKGDNTLLLNSGVIQCDASFDVCEGIRSELDVVKDKVSSIYDTVVDGIRETRHYPKLQNGWVTNSKDYTPTFVKFGNLVTFNMRIKGGKWSSATIIVDNLPEEFRVKAGHAQVFPAIDLANDKTYNAIMYKEGHIKLYGVDAEPTGGLAIMGTYYVN